jgi:hypothetical protein
LKAWAERYAPASDAWRQVTLSDASALYLDTGIAKASYPLIGYRMKYENFAPAEADGHPFRSTAVTYQADCSRMLHRTTRVTAFARLGLKGASFEAANPTPDWETPQMGSDSYRLTALACTLAQPAHYDLDDPRLIHFEAQAISTDEIAAGVWVAQNGLANKGWSLIGTGDQSVEFISDRAFDFDAYPLVRYDAKTEFFEPVSVGPLPVRSERRRVEVDCDRHRVRELSITFHEDQNLAGLQVSLPATTWTAPMRQAMPLSPTIACVFAYDLKFNRGLTTASAAGQDLF